MYHNMHIFKHKHVSDCSVQTVASLRKVVINIEMPKFGPL